MFSSAEFNVKTLEQMRSGIDHRMTELKQSYKEGKVRRSELGFSLAQYQREKRALGVAIAALRGEHARSG